MKYLDDLSSSPYTDMDGNKITPREAVKIIFGPAPPAPPEWADIVKSWNYQDKEHAAPL